MRRITTAALILVVIGAIGITACDDTSQSEDQRRESVNQRADTFERAKRAAPTPKTVNFPLRKALVEFTERQDQINHPWYVYILADTGNVVGYYVAKTVPINACDFLSSTEEINDDNDSTVVVTAPSLDGIFYGGAGASSGCDSWFFFDAATNALVQIRGVKWFSADQPLRLDANPISVAAG